MSLPSVPIFGEAEKVVAVAYYEAQDEWQLTLYENDIITVTDKYEGNPEYEGLCSLNDLHTGKNQCTLWHTPNKDLSQCTT